MECSMETKIPEKAALLTLLKEGKFNVPDFIYVSASDFKNENFKALETFLDRHRESFKVIARSAHLREAFFKGGTFDSLETYADLGGIQYAGKKLLNWRRMPSGCRFEGNKNSVMPPQSIWKIWE